MQTTYSILKNYLNNMTTTLWINWASTTLPWDTINWPQGFGQNYQTVTSVSSWNLTVAIKTLAGTDPSATDPIYVRIGNIVRSITSALTWTKNAGTDYCNLWSAELATNEVDMFSYFGWNTNTNAVELIAARFPFARTYADFTPGAPNLEKFPLLWSAMNSTDQVECIGRFNATLSGGAGYTWSIPATSVIVNRPTFITDYLSFSPTITATGSMTVTRNPSSAFHRYRIEWWKVIADINEVLTLWWSASYTVIVTLPFSCKVALAWWDAGYTWPLQIANWSIGTILVDGTSSNNNANLRFCADLNSWNYNLWSQWIRWQVIYEI